MGRTKSYEGTGITVHFEARKCIHAARCVTKLPAVFNVERRPWIDPTDAQVDELAAVIELCPSGALTYERTDGGPAENAPSECTVEAVENGPLYVRGAMELVDQSGNAITSGPRAALCRCGASSNKPFCDNSHVETGFVTDS